LSKQILHNYALQWILIIEYEDKFKILGNWAKQLEVVQEEKLL
jgi:hypothetical protein